MTGALSHIAASLTRLYPLASGCGRVANSALLRGLTPRAPGGGPASLVRARPRGGGRMWVDPGDYVGRSIYFIGELDPKVTWALRRVLRRGDTFIDIGANQGLVSFIAARIVGPRGRVHAFEPQPRLAALLRRSVGEAGLSQVTVHEVALSDRDGVARLTVPAGNAGAASLGEHLAGVPGSAVEVRLVRGDGYLAALGLGLVRAMKVDVEGHEGQVFAGLQEMLGSVSAPDLIVFESANDRPLHEREACRALTRAPLEYRLADLPPCLFRPRARWIGPDGGVRGHDLLAVRAGSDAADRLGLPAERGLVRVAPGALQPAAVTGAGAR
jgi:FkbM family methyltransferase